MARSGFTLIEILVVILIIGLLAAYFGQNIFEQSEDAKIAVVETQLKERFPAAILSLLSADPSGGGAKLDNPTGGNFDLDSALAARGAPDKTPWGAQISSRLDITPPDNNMVWVKYPIPAKIDRSAIVKSLNESPGGDIVTSRTRFMKTTRLSFTTESLIL